ncbi:hypothetical protein BLNAU_6745 [Blattamonas nauphoetae]|uniref:Uncharacterized protein n=1 Tax=Blattamonas nauphoetae TaxID=2049346 RepID=A0ABQ9Y3D6_9EUKA|nr:hypothetical protein BLNAU_6745 [Blattamonas nauphoetae]
MHQTYTSNSTFRHIQNEQKYTEHQDISENVTFKWDTFSDITTATSNGGALFFTGTGRLQILYCIFENCETTKTRGFGGAIHGASGTITIHESLFKSCSAHCGGAVSGNNCAIQIETSTFTTCFSTAPVNDEVYSDNTATNEITGGGGAIWFYLNSNFVILDSLFVSCSANSFGGGIVFYPFSSLPPQYFRMFSVVFQDTNVTVDKKDKSGGHNVMLTHSQFYSQTPHALQCYDFFYPKQDEPESLNDADGTFHLESVFSTSSKVINHVFQFGKSAYIDQVLLNTTGQLIVSVEGDDTIKCSDSPKCRTLTFAMRKARTGAEVSVEEGVFGTESYEERNIPVLARNLTVTGDGSDKSSLTFQKPLFDNDGNFLITSGSVSASHLKLIKTSALDGEWNLFHVETGSLILKSSHLCGTDEQQTGSLCYLEGGTMTIEDCTFSNFLSSPTGHAVYAYLTPTSSVLVSSSTFTNCQPFDTDKNYEGLVHLFTEPGASGYTLTNLTFESDTVVAGQDIFIDSDNVFENLDAEKFAVGWKNDRIDNTRFRARSRSAPFRRQTEFGIPRFLSSKYELYLNSTASDETECGSFESPCVSFTFLATQHEMLAGYTIVLSSDGVLSGFVDLSDVHVQEMENNEKGLVLVQLTETIDTSLIVTTGDLSFENVDFVFGEIHTGSCSSLISVTGDGSLTLDNCHFCSDSDETRRTFCPLLNVEAGHFVADTLAVSHLVIPPSVISIQSSQIEIGSISVQHCGLSPLPDSKEPTIRIVLESGDNQTLKVGSILMSDIAPEDKEEDAGISLVSISSTARVHLECTNLLESVSTDPLGFSFSPKLESTVTHTADPQTVLSISFKTSFELEISAQAQITTPDPTTADSFVTISEYPLTLRDCLLNFEKLDGFFSTALFHVSENRLEITQTALSPFLSSLDSLPANLFLVTGGGLTVKNVLIDGSAFTSQTGSVLIQQNAGSISVSFCTFQNVLTTADTAVIELSPTIVSFPELTIDNSLFSNVSSSSPTGKGVLNADINHVDFRVAENVSFVDCVSEQSLSNCILLRHDALSGEFITNSLLLDWEKTEASEHDFVGLEGSFTRTAPLFLFLKQLGDVIFVGSSFFDSDGCGFENYPCESIGQARLRLAARKEQKIVILDHTSLERDYVVEDSSLEMSGRTDSAKLHVEGQVTIRSTFMLRSLVLTLPQFLRAEQPFLMICSEGSSLEVDFCSFETALETAYQFGLFSCADTSTLTFMNSQITTGLILDKYAVFNVDAGSSVKIEGCSFTNITRVEGEGSVISAILSDHQVLSLDDVNITDCSSSEGDKAQSIFIAFEEMNPASTFVFTNLLFNQSLEFTSRRSSDSHPHQIVLTGAALYKLINADHWKGSFEHLRKEDPVEEAVLWSRDTHFQLSVSLLEYLIPFDGDVLLKGSGTLIPICGSPRMPCKTLQSGVLRMDEGRGGNVEDEVEIGDSDVVLSGNKKLRGLGQTSGFSFSSQLNNQIICGTSSPEDPSSLSFHSLIFHSPSHIPAIQTSLILVHSGTTSFFTCSFVSGSPTSAAVLVEGGVVELENTTLQIDSTTSVPFCFQNSNSTTVTSFHLSSFSFNVFKATSVQCLILSDIRLNNSTSGPSRVDQEICSWAGGIIRLEECTTTISDSVFSAIKQGVLEIVGGTASINHCSFQANVIASTTYPSLQHNIACVGGSLEVGEGNSFTQTHSTDQVSMWISNTDCILTDHASHQLTHPLFIPDLPAELVVTPFSNKTIPSSRQAATVSLSGQNLLPCNTSLIVFLAESTTLNTLTIDLTSDTLPSGVTNLQHSGSDVTFLVDPKTASLKDGEWMMSVAVDGECLKEYNLFSISLARKQRVVISVSIAIPISLLILLILLIILIVCCVVKRRREESEEEKEPLLDGQRLSIQTEESGFSISHKSSAGSHIDYSNEFEAPNNVSMMAAPSLVPLAALGVNIVPVAGLSKTSAFCVSCQGPEYPFAFGEQRRNMYSKIHGSIEQGASQTRSLKSYKSSQKSMKGRNPLRLGYVQAFSIVTSIAKTFKFLKEKSTQNAKVSDSSDAVFPPFTIRSVSTWSIIHYPDNSLLVVLPAAYSQQLGLAEQPDQDNSSVHTEFGSEAVDKCRWYAPEDKDNTNLDPDQCEKALVFSLGLVLFELLSGDVPFGELDATTARRRMQHGATPDLDLSIPESVRKGLTSSKEEEKRAAESSIEAKFPHILAGALELDPVDRFTLSSFIEAMNEVLPQESVDSRSVAA